MSHASETPVLGTIAAMAVGLFERCGPAPGAGDSATALGLAIAVADAETEAQG
ncbi:hypothetical protein M5362_01890 [Streptomyces sp. Je 1-79]|uniref:hypothetical protein n=1 Tax=Streptomyces sp. Je 1-79 TaxID=2943847 RepID=UPI0021A2AE01|nr:hypothetical protein [Streptomyces sp. Je 1-79]MCT4351885.1 hypothetical protein [Streptomyces sp. Je 1-79]